MESVSPGAVYFRGCCRPGAAGPVPRRRRARCYRGVAATGRSSRTRIRIRPRLAGRAAAVAGLRWVGLASQDRREGRHRNAVVPLGWPGLAVPRRGGGCGAGGGGQRQPTGSRSSGRSKEPPTGRQAAPGPAGPANGRPARPRRCAAVPRCACAEESRLLRQPVGSKRQGQAGRAGSLLLLLRQSLPRALPARCASCCCSAPQAPSSPA